MVTQPKIYRKLVKQLSGLCEEQIAPAAYVLNYRVRTFCDLRCLLNAHPEVPDAGQHGAATGDLLQPYSWKVSAEN
jgi:hypothetical protein